MEAHCAEPPALSHRGTPKIGSSVMPPTVISRPPGFASFLYRLLFPHDAYAAEVGSETVSLCTPRAARVIYLKDITEVSLSTGHLRTTVHMHGPSWRIAVSGLPRSDATTLAEALKTAQIAQQHEARARAEARRLARIEQQREDLARHADAAASLTALLDDIAEPTRYLRRSAFRTLVKTLEETLNRLPDSWPAALENEPVTASIRRARTCLDHPERARESANEVFIAVELERARQFLDTVEARPLTDEQRRAVVVDDDRNLITAAAGSGKTSVMVAKAGWILNRGDRRPADLLFLAFARDARDELAGRIHERLGVEAAATNIHTFHSLGLSITAEAEGRQPSVARVDGADLITEIITDLLEQKRAGDDLVKWWAYDSMPYHAIHKFETPGDYWEYLRNNEIRTLQGEMVKSFEECFIANFLYLNGIQYDYERQYEHDTATRKRRQYRPDFYLKDYRIYIEHFALNEVNETPPFIDGPQYRASREWKLQLHEKHNTILVETFSWEQAKGHLLKRLRAKLSKHGVTFTPRRKDEVFAVLNEKRRIGPFVKLVSTFLKHFKGSRLSFDELKEKTLGPPKDQRAASFLRVFRPILRHYQATLERSEEIDFEDMINRATGHVRSGLYRHSFGYILVDEFQDISPGRAALLQALLRQNPDSQLFAVGDDWQAIYRFSGTDIDVMRRFDRYFESHTRTDLETTFRCSSGLADTATKFILKNPSQIVKRVRAIASISGPGVWIGGGSDGPALDAALGRIAEENEETGSQPTVLLLGRYHRDQPDLSALGRKYGDRLNLAWRTIHAAKGLEADYAVTVDVSAGTYGFPSEVVDDPLLDLVLSEPESYPHAEERRLLYVALTRAKRRAYLLEADSGPRSTFITELLKRHPAAGEDAVGVFGLPTAGSGFCPQCHTGALLPRENKRGSRFYGCSNYPYCEHSEGPCSNCERGLPLRNGDTVVCPACGEGLPACPRCTGGWLGIRKSANSRFLSCSNWRNCSFRRPI